MTIGTVTIMSLYTSDFKVSTIDIGSLSNLKSSQNVFSVISNKFAVADDDFPKYSIIEAAKPFLYFTSLCGFPIVRYNENNLRKVNIFRKIYCSLVIVIMISILIIVKPVSWIDTVADVPLNILTKLFGLAHNTEMMYSIFTMTFFNSGNHIKLLKTFNDIDKHLREHKMTFRKMRSMSIVFVILPLTQFMLTFFLRKFNIRNIAAHLILLLTVVQGSIIYFFVLNFYLRQFIFNLILNMKLGEIKKRNLRKTSVETKKIMPGVTFNRRTKIHSITPGPVCWLELMQIYDKTADCLYIFNKIYGRQVFFMFFSWLVCTLLTICRSLSPSLKYSELYLSDMFLYTCINIRPFFLAIMCELIVKQWKKTQGMLLHILIHEELDEAYYTQVQTMLDLVESRKHEISANIFPVNLPTVMHFAGRAISYVVLMIQYFYMHTLKD